MSNTALRDIIERILHVAQSVTKFNLLNKKYQKIIHRPLNKMQKVCGFITIHAAFRLFNVLQTSLTSV